MTGLRRAIKSRMERAVLDFNMIRPGDRIAVGVSGGPDSLSLLSLLIDGFGYATSNYSLLAVHLDMGFDESGTKNRERLESLFRSFRVEYRIERTDIAQRVFSQDAGKNPCFLCSLFRRKRLYEIADREGCGRIAYGHHQDDIIETLLLNILYGRKIGTMYPVQEIFGGKLALIRPFAYVEESSIKRFAAESGLPALPRLCPMDGKTRRQRVKQIITDLQKGEPHADIRGNIFKALYHLELKEFPGVKTSMDAEKPEKQL
jgi:tRNA 2-thiocytidine biosynthesis protein TtcA